MVCAPLSPQLPESWLQRPVYSEAGFTLNMRAMPIATAVGPKARNVFSATRTLGSWVRILLVAWMYVYFFCVRVVLRR
jgi:hypothetical protein